MLKTLSETDSDFLAGPPIIVSCARCTMTMAAVSPNAMVDDRGYIVCRGCCTKEELSEETQSV